MEEEVVNHKMNKENTELSNCPYVKPFSASIDSNPNSVNEFSEGVVLCAVKECEEFLYQTVEEINQMLNSDQVK